MYATTYKGVVFHIGGLMSWNGKPSKSYQALTCEHVLTYELNHMWLPPKHIISPTPPPPPPPPSQKRDLVHMVYAQCVLLKDYMGFDHLLFTKALSYAVSCYGSKRSNYKGTQCFCNYQWAILTIQFVTSLFD